MSSSPTKEKINEEKKTNEVSNEVKSDAKSEETPKKGSSFLTSSVPAKAESEAPSEENIKKVQEEFLEKNFEDDILFKSKCKLFAYNKTKKKMEERGVGDIMVSKDKNNDMVKVVMIRESVMRFGCNHYINPKFKLEKHSKIVNALVWATTEDTVDPDAPKDASQIFLVKFDDEELATKFKEEFDKGSLNNKTILEAK